MASQTPSQPVPTLDDMQGHQPRQLCQEVPSMKSQSELPSASGQVNWSRDTNIPPPDHSSMTHTPTTLSSSAELSHNRYDIILLY